MSALQFQPGCLDLGSRIEAYWKPTNKDGFLQTTQRLKTYEAKIKEWCQGFSEYIARKELVALWCDFVDLVRPLETDIYIAWEKANELAISSAGIAKSKSNTPFHGDVESFQTRINQLEQTLSEVYQNTVYPCILLLQDAEKEKELPIWNLSRIVRPLSNLYNTYMLQNPRKTVLGIFESYYFPSPLQDKKNSSSPKI